MWDSMKLHHLIYALVFFLLLIQGCSQQEQIHHLYQEVARHESKIWSLETDLHNTVVQLRAERDSKKSP